LFKHLRGEDDASINCPLSVSPANEEEILMAAAIRYGYYYDGNIKEDTPNEVVANMIYQAFKHQMDIFLDDKEDGELFTASALTYSTAAKMRQPSLGQDKGVKGAVAEVLSFNYRLSNTPMVISKWKEVASSGILQSNMQDWLNNENRDNQIQIQLHNMDLLVPRSSKFYAERSATQISYRYILPISWILPNDKDTTRDEEMAKAIVWWKYIKDRSSSNHRTHEPRGKNSPLCPEFIKKLKQSLKQLESKTVANRKLRRKSQKETSPNDEEYVDSSDSSRLSPGRFGQLWRKEKRCWSNFADGKGLSVSPGFEAVWRSIDRAKIVGFIQNEEKNESLDDTIRNMHIVIEFRADGFVMGQIPRLISSLVALTNGWLPQNFFDVATRPDVYMPVTTVSSRLDKRMYFHSARYHFHELTSNGLGDDKTGNSLASTINSSSPEDNWELVLRDRLLLSGKGDTTIESIEDEWLLELRDVTSVNLRKQIDKIETEEIVEQSLQSRKEDSTSLPLVDTDAPSGAYSTTLELLRNVIESGRWPTTSDARSKVIKASDTTTNAKLATKKKATISQFPNTESGDIISSGSFTVVNGDIWDSSELPLANSLFPELTKAVFELEKEIIKQSTESPLPAAEGMNRSQQQRHPSSHCAVNRNARFTPHVDSGRGKGQSVSMIVGLGNYTGGETIVEGKPYAIRYDALEFDGWNQLHWTNSFVGERYSLVWFTPEEVSKDEKSTKLNDDERASRLAQLHSNTVPYLPPLKFRHDSTDALVINEILKDDSNNVYFMKPATNMPLGFSLQNHKCILDCGAHIGVFSRYALSQGCEHIIAYEPEPSNYNLLSENLNIIRSQSEECPTIELYQFAVAQSSGLQTLVQARHENSGKQNTWRHSLSQYAVYVDRDTKMSSDKQMNTLQTFEVECKSFFRDVLRSGISFVKIDVEGAEIDILVSEEASYAKNWIDVTNLVFEWSFTKERRIDVFKKAVSNLHKAGFAVHYEGMGSWWDNEGILWPYPTDMIVFAVRDII